MNVGFEIQFCSLEKKEKGKEHHHHIGMWMHTIHILSSHCGALTHGNRQEHRYSICYSTFVGYYQ